MVKRNGRLDIFNAGIATFRECQTVKDQQERVGRDHYVVRHWRVAADLALQLVNKPRIARHGLRHPTWKMNQTSPNAMTSDSQNDGLLSTSFIGCSKASSCASDQIDNFRLICLPNKNGGQKTYSIGLGAIIKPIGEDSLKNLFGFFVKCFCEMRIESPII